MARFRYIYRRLRAYRLRARFWRDIASISKSLPEVAATSSLRPMIVVSTGRTGTKWFASLFSSLPDVLSVHEPIPHENFAWAAAIADPKSVTSYARFRARYIRSECERTSCRAYVESNGLLRRHVRAIKEADPSVYIPHIIRDGRDVVSSIMNRHTMTDADPYYHFFPGYGDQTDKPWSRMSKFERICVVWKMENEYLLENCDTTIRFEDMLSDYDAFYETFCRPISIHLPRETWSKAVARAENENKDLTFPKWECWSDEEKSCFAHYCGDLMRKCGYEL